MRAACTVVQQSAAGNKLLVGYVAGAVQADDRARRRRRADAGQPRPDDRGARRAPDRDLGQGRPQGAALAAARSAANDDAELTEAERRLAEHWREQLGPVAIGPDSDFFVLGGTSLAAAKLISVLRVEHPAVAVADVYEHRTLRAFAAHLEASPARRRRGRRGLARGRRASCSCCSCSASLVLFAIQGVPWLLGTLVYGNLVDIGTPHVSWVGLLAAWALLASPPAHVALQFVATRVLLRGVKPGRYSRYSSLTARLWFIDRLAEVTRYERLGGTPWAARYARLVGAKVGDGARLATVPPAGALLTVGAGATVEGNVDMRGWWIDGQELVVGAIEIGAGARIGSRSMLNPGAVIGEGAEIEPGTVVTGEIGAGERWGGAPGRRLGDAGEHWPAEPPAPTRAGFWALAFAASLGLELMLGLAAFLPRSACSRCSAPSCRP